jgi:hypothetical protein
MIRALLTLLLGTVVLGLPGLDVDSEHASERETSLAKRRERAAEFRLQQNAFVKPPGYDAAAAAELARIEAMWAAGNIKGTYRDADDLADDYRFSDAAPRALHLYILAAARRKKIANASRKLVDLWYRYPAYDAVDDLLLATLDRAEELQNSAAILDFSAEKPRDVINTSVDYDLYAADMLFFFLAKHGDLHYIAPRASIGLARSLLISGRKNKTRILQARLAYQEFLFRYPEDDLVFDVLCELALTQLLLFRGDRFDGGALENAELLIDQAELYTDNQAERQQLITRYRDMITRWRQQKDYSVARWYHRKGHDQSALYYYREALRYDPDSNLAQNTRRAIAELESSIDQP